MTRQSPAADDALANTCRQRSRRQLLAAGAAVATVGLAGCTRAINYIAGLALGDVNLFNETDRRLGGSIVVTDPDGSVVLDESFDIEPNDDEDDEDGVDTESETTYGDVLAGPGEYTVSVELDDDSAVDGTTEAETGVEVADPDEDHIIVVFGADDLDDPIGILVIQEFTDMGDHIDD